MNCSCGRKVNRKIGKAHCACGKTHVSTKQGDAVVVTEHFGRSRPSWVFADGKLKAR